MLFAVFVVAGLVAGWIARGSLDGLVQIRFRSAWLILLALLLKIQLFLPIFATPDVLWMAQLQYSFVNWLLVVGVALNSELPGLKLLAVGLLLNYTVITFNGGCMPVSTAALEAAGRADQAAELQAAGRLPTGCVLDDSTRLALLGDWLTVPPPAPFAGAISLGDLLIGAGAFWLVARSMQLRPAITQPSNAGADGGRR